MATIPIKQPTLAGVAIGYTAAADGGDQFLNDGKVMLIVRNTGSGDITATISPPIQPQSGLDFSDIDVTVTAANVSASNRNACIGPFNPEHFNDASGYVQITYDDYANTSVTVVRMRK